MTSKYIIRFGLLVLASLGIYGLYLFGGIETIPMIICGYGAVFFAGIKVYLECQ